MRCVVVFCMLVGVSHAQVAPQVTIPGQGTIEGDTELSYINKRQFHRFRGVPFAARPERFQPPVPAIPWDGVLDATEWGQMCMQGSVTLAADPENCLYIHVYTPNLDPVANIPVIVYIHGGGFTSGSALGWGPEMFMDQDIVLVIPHYRLGVFGFLSLETEEIAGNMGMLDQVAALQWVVDYIFLFGGNPGSITVMGESAGAASSSLLAISPLSTGLFQRYISESGSATGEWVIDRSPVASAIEIGRLAGCTDSETTALTACLMAVDAQTLQDAFSNFTKSEDLAGVPIFGGGGSLPTIQKSGSRRFLEREPRDILAEGAYVTKPAIIGSNKHEGTFTYQRLYESYFAPNGLLDDTQYWKREATNFMLEWYRVVDQGETLASGVEKAFFGLENVGNLTAMTPGMVDFLGDMHYKGAGYEQALYNSKFQPTYIYSYNFLGSNSLWVSIGGNTSIIEGGVCHSNELLMLFSVPLTVLDPEERSLSQKMIKLWTNFAIYGDPTPLQSPVEGVPTWEALDSSRENFLLIEYQPVMAEAYTTTQYYIARDEGFPYNTFR